MKTRITHLIASLGTQKLLLATLAASLTGCVAPNSQPFEFPTEQAVAYRKYANDVAQEDRQLQYSDRLNEAKAREMETRHAPSSVSNTNVYAPRYNY